MKTVKDYMNRIRDCKNIMSDIGEMYDWLVDECKEKCPTDPLVIDRASEMLGYYIESLEDTVVCKK